MSNVTKLPTAATSYYTVNKHGSWFNVILVTPIKGLRPAKTVVCGFSDKQTAMEYGRKIAARMQRPFKYRGAAS